MKRRTSTSVVTVYTFGGGRCIENEDLVFDTMEKAHRYSNKLIEIERERRALIREAQRSCDVLVPLFERTEEIRGALDAEYDALSTEKAKSRSRKVPPDKKARITELKRELKQAFDALKEKKAQTSEELKPLYEKIEEYAGARVREARARSGVYHPTYQLVEAAAKASRNKLAKQLSEKHDPSFRSFPRPYGARVPQRVSRGRIGILPGGKHITVQQAFAGTSDWLRIDPVSPYVYFLPRGERQRAIRKNVSFRVGSNPDKTPIWATFSNVHIHRELPADGKITMAWFKLETKGDRKSDQHWELQLTVEASSKDVVESHPHPHAVAAINIGWRELEQGRRVAYVVDLEGEKRELLYLPTPKKGVEKPNPFEHANSLHSIRDRMFDEMLRELSIFISRYATPPLEIKPPKAPESVSPAVLEKRNELQTLLPRIFQGSDESEPEPPKETTDPREEESIKPELPLFLRGVARYIRQWKSTSRLAGLVRRWKENRFEGDGEIYPRLIEWLEQDAHLYQWETRERSRAQGARQELYRTYARELCSRYGVLILGKADLAQFAKKSAPEVEDDKSERHRRQRAEVAPSEFIFALSLFAKKKGVSIIKMDSSYITQTCSFCGHVEEWDARSKLEHTCSNCRRNWDQDVNACRNLLHRYTAASTLPNLLHSRHEMQSTHQEHQAWQEDDGLGL